MGSLTLSKINRLYWMGRYAERVHTTLRFLLKYYDELIDGQPQDHHEICQELVIPDIYKDNADFLFNFTFDPNNPNSMYVAADRMLGNGMTLRETISSETLAYLQMAFNDLLSAKDSKSPALEVQKVLDDIMAFRGCFDDIIADEGIRNVIKCGLRTERVSLNLRLGASDEECLKEITKLLRRVEKTPVRTRSLAYSQLLQVAANGDAGKLPENRTELVMAAENLIEI